MTINFSIVNGDGSDIDVRGADQGPTIVNATDNSETINMSGAADVVNAGDGDDVVAGNHGQDTLRGDGGDDTLKGQGSKDKLFGGEGDDVLEGGAGNDRLFGGEGDDTIIGGNDDDVLFGDARNQFEGATGSDVFVFDKDDGNDKVWDFVSGVDLIQLIEGADDLSIEFRGENSIVSYGSTTITVYNVHLDVEVDFFS